MGLPSVINGIDGSAQRRFSELHVHARVLDTGDRTISIDQIATVSVENRRYRLWRWLAWGLAATLAAVAVGQIVSALLLLSFGAWVVVARMLPALPPALGAVVLIVAARRLRDSMFLQIGTSDGNRTVFHSQDRDQLLQVKTFLLHKINERDIAATYQFHFGDDIADGRTVDGPSMDGAGNQPIAGVRNARPHGNAGHVAHVDYGAVLPQVGQMREFYARQPNMQHLESRLAELEMLMRSGTPSMQGRGRIRELSTDLSNILHAYPSMVQFFHHVAQLAA